LQRVGPACEHTFVSTDPTILHADVDAFFASVEQRDDPRLRGKPVIVGGGVVMAASYEARAMGVRGAMGGRQARRLCPDAIVVTPRFKAYVQASKDVFAIFEDTAPMVEGLSMEEAFLDVRGLERISGSPREIAERLRARVLDRVGLTVTVGVARTKHLAKVASAAAKPDGLLVVPPEEETAFLHPLPIEALWGVGPATAAKLHERGIHRVEHLAAVPGAALAAMLGRAAGWHLHAIANNRDPRPVRARRRRRSLGSQSALGSRARSPAELDAVLVALVDRVTRRMRSSGLVGRTITLRLRFADYSRASRSRSLAQATAGTQATLRTVRELYADARPVVAARGLTLLGLTFTNLGHVRDGVQLALPLEAGASHRLDDAVDRVREQFGPEALTRATLLRAGLDLAPALSPDELDE
jgi:DNA polymerase-4